MKITRCKDITDAAAEAELEEIRKEFELIYFNNRSAKNKIPGSTPTFAASQLITTAKEPVFNQHHLVPDTRIILIAEARFLTSAKRTIELASKECPAQRETYDVDDLSNSLWKSVSTDFYKYIAQLGKLFGDVSYVQKYINPLDGIVLVSQPTNLCQLLFNQTTLTDVLHNPTCTVESSLTQTEITVKVGENAKVRKGTVLKVLPNVFANGCDWPVMNTLKITNAADLNTLDVKFAESALTAVA